MVSAESDKFYSNVTRNADAFGYNERGEVVFSHGGTETQRVDYTWDGWLLVRETVTDLSTFQPLNFSTDYVWGKDLSGSFQGAGGVGGLLYEERDGAIYVPFYDNNGNVTRYLDTNGNTVAQYTYDAFGNIVAQSGAMADDFRHRFSTKYFDTETGLYYYGYRYYKPPLMRWLNCDPIGEDGGLNLYAFCGNNPIAKIDYNGLTVVVIKHFAGQSPPDGWKWPDSRAETKWTHPSYTVYGIPCGENKNGYYVWIDPPIIFVNVYFRSADNVILAMSAEQEHIDAIKRYDEALTRYKHELEKISECSTRAKEMREELEEILEKALFEADDYHNKLDAPGGPHGHH